MTTCPHCEEIADTPVCPHCGQQVPVTPEGEILIKIAVMLLLIASIVVLGIWFM
jgi:hypothetical protein